MHVIALGKTNTQKSKQTSIVIYKKWLHLTGCSHTAPPTGSVHQKTGIYTKVTFSTWNLLMRLKCLQCDAGVTCFSAGRLLQPHSFCFTASTHHKSKNALPYYIMPLDVTKCCSLIIYFLSQSDALKSPALVSLPLCRHHNQ